MLCSINDGGGRRGGGGGRERESPPDRCIIQIHAVNFNKTMCGGACGVRV